MSVFTRIWRTKLNNLNGVKISIKTRIRWLWYGDDAVLPPADANDIQLNVFMLHLPSLFDKNNSRTEQLDHQLQVSGWWCAEVFWDEKSSSDSFDPGIDTCLSSKQSLWAPLSHNGLWKPDLAQQLYHHCFTDTLWKVKTSLERQNWLLRASNNKAQVWTQRCLSKKQKQRNGHDVSDNLQQLVKDGNSELIFHERVRVTVFIVKDTVDCVFEENICSVGIHWDF